jgi:hypothetical protein
MFGLDACLLPVRDVWPRCSLSDVFGGDYWGTLQTQDDEIFFSLVWENCMVEILSTTTLGRDPIHERTKKNRWLKIVTYEYEEVEGSHPSSSSTAPRSQKSSRFEDFFYIYIQGVQNLNACSQGIGPWIELYLHFSVRKRVSKWAAGW